MADVIKTDPPDRRQFQEILSGMTEGVVLVETDRRIVWANQAALAMHGATKVDDLGATVDDYAARFTLRYRNQQPVPASARPLERLCSGETFGDLVVETRRTADLEADWVHRVRGFTLNDDAGHADLRVLVVTDATDAFEAEERFERMFNANPAPALIARVADLRYVRVNHGFLELTGYQSADIVGRSVYELDILDGVEEREIAKAKLADWKTVPQMEAELTLPGGDRKLVIVAGHPIEVKDERCMLFTFADLEPKRRAERALRVSEERFAKSFRLAPVPMKLTTLEGFRLINVNHAFLQLTGWSLEEVIGRAPSDIELWDSSATRRDVEKQLVETGAMRGSELKLKSKAGRLIDCLASAETLEIDGVRCVLTVLQDITERKRTENELVAAVEAAVQDSTWLSRGILDKLAGLRAQPSAVGGAAIPPARTERLTQREQQVLALVANGKGDKAIADDLSLTTNTVRNHVARLYRKIGAHNRAEAVIWARERGINSQPR